MHALLLGCGMVRTLDVAVKRQEHSLLCPYIMMWRCAEEIRVYTFGLLSWHFLGDLKEDLPTRTRANLDAASTQIRTGAVVRSEAEDQTNSIASE